MPKIFVSHSSKDNVFAEKLANALRQRGAEVWIDLSDIPAGMKWSTAIQQGLNLCEVMILVITPDSMASVNVEDEWQYYIDKKKGIIPVRWIPADVHFQLNRYQYVDFHERDFDAALAKLITELARWGFVLPKPPIDEKPTSPPTPLSGERGADALPSPPLRSERGTGGEAVRKARRAGGEARTFPLIIKPKWVGKIIPEPFEWCVVPAGQVTLEPSGSQDDYLTQKQTFDVPEFQIARCPITNAQFEAFVAANDGWRDASWWDYSAEAKTWHKENVQSEPPRFKDCADCPRERVTWYAAVAFTRWLSAKTGEQITLPTEGQWQRAAQGDDGRVYPWGNEWDAAKCNSSESGIGRTTPVTQYPQGTSPFGVMDMSGNVWEWCSTDFRTGKSDMNGTNVRVLRGGSWSSYPLVARAAYRLGVNPFDWYYGWGCRVVVGAVPI